ncbi:MAG: helix-turn-helix domain-containing protein [Roseiarcus sp.]
MLRYVPGRGHFRADNMSGETELDRKATQASQDFARALRERRKAIGMTQDDLALATGVGRRFIIELESGKPTAQIGRSLLIAQKLGFAMHQARPLSVDAETPSLPDMEDENEDAGPAHIL